MKTKVINNDLNDWIDYIFDRTDTDFSELDKYVSKSYEEYAKAKNLKVPNPQKIRAGKIGGHPLESITTDLYLGCLPASSVCYGNCNAAKLSFLSGFDFGIKVENILDKEVFIKDLKNIPSTQGFLTNGWNSDPSWNWEKAFEMAKLIRKSGRLPILMTKVYKFPSEEMMQKFANIKAEIRVSVSAFDKKEQLRQRFDFIHHYRNCGGIAIPMLISTYFKRGNLNRKQDKIVEYISEKDILGAENSLRFDKFSPVSKMVDLDKCRRIESTKDYWCGRIFSEELKVPITTTLPPYYLGMQNPYMSKNEEKFLNSLWYENVYTHEEVIANAELLNNPTIDSDSAKLA
ncbi:hypothetical protein [Aureivirga marina]|uniref:hypothetical protein n=1 Tax=Aureivirga marina TaxID=1182451 RepID=UPI0018CBD923|nr:hypothetical protein [Aureivirga marina]